ncbi:unnamed protein product [Aphanomyces euteiches]
MGNYGGPMYSGAGYGQRNNVKIDVNLTALTTPPIVPQGNRKKRKSRSWVWEYFTLVHADSIDGVGFVQCNICESNGQCSQGRYKYSGGTSNMSLHLTRKHQLSEDSVALTMVTQPNTPVSSSNPSPSASSTPQRSQTPPPGIESSAKRRLVKCKKKESSGFKNDVLRLFIQENIPLRLLESSNFQAMIVGPLPTQADASQLIEDKYKACCESISTLLATDSLHVTVSVEEFLYPSQGLTAVAVGLHWVDRHFCPYRVLVMVETFPHDLQLSQVMALLSRLYRIIPHLQESILFFVTSSERLHTLLSTIAPVSSGEFSVVLSLTHIINRCVEEGLRVVTPLLDKVTSIATVMGLGRNSGGDVSDVSTRTMPWRQTLVMLQNVSSLQTENDKKNDEGTLTLDESDQIQSIISLLLPFETAESMLSANATYGLVVPVLENLRGLVTKNEGAPSVKAALLVALSDAVSTCEALGAVAAMLDPRFKHMQFVSPIVKENARFSLQQACESVVLSNEVTVNDKVEEKKEENSPGQLAKAMASFFGLAGQKSSQHEIDVYLEFPSLPFDAASDPIVWWNANQSSFPRLAKLARDYFSIPSSCLVIPELNCNGPFFEQSVQLCLRSFSQYTSLFDIFVKDEV